MLNKIVRGTLTCLGIAAVIVAAVNAEEKGGKMNEALEELVRENSAQLVEFRRDLHRHPEVSGDEVRTSRIVAERLRALGLDVRTGIGGYGVVAVLQGAKDGPVVAWRADMDALNSDAPDPASFASETSGVRHICGHDVHTTIGVGIAEALAAVRDQLSGTVVFIFQPSEETAEGAAAMIADRALDDPAPAAIFAVHCAPLETGQVGSGAGMLLSGVDLVTVTLTGSGDIMAAAERCGGVINSANESVSEAGFIEAVVFESGFDETTGAFVGRALVRASSPKNRARAQNAIESGLAGVNVPGVTCAVEYEKHVIPDVNNDATLVEAADAVIREVSGESAVYGIDAPTPSFSEDFAFFQERIPGAMFFLGVSNADEGIVGMPHQPSFMVDEDAIAFGVRTMSLVLVDYLESHR